MHLTDSALATAFSHYTGPLKRLFIDFKCRSPNEEPAAPLDIIVDASCEDSLNVALRELIQRGDLSEVKILLGGGFVVSPEFFWPYGEAQVRPTTTFWPNFEVLLMRCSLATPDGDWYFIADENNTSRVKPSFHPRRKTLRSYHRVENTFRNFPNSEKMNPLLASIARAVQFAPSIRQLCLSFGDDGLIPGHSIKETHLVRYFEVYYTAPGAKAREENRVTNPGMNCGQKTGDQARWLNGFGGMR